MLKPTNSIKPKKGSIRNMKTNNFSSDSPVSLEDEDRFQRWNFSSRIGEVVAKRSDESSIIIGLYGPWGDGKTSVLNFIEKSLLTNIDVVCIKFNPWRYGGEDELLIGFFHQVAEALDAKLTTGTDTFKSIVKKGLPIAGAFLGSKDAGEGIGAFIAGPTIEELKARLEKELTERKKRILILVDDIDRLDKQEIYSLFRLVKLTADFKYTAYILAFDKDIVAASLQERYAGQSGNSGYAFLEKIIQVPLFLPAINKNTLVEVCFEGVLEALELSEIELSDEQMETFVGNFTLAFTDKLKTPRRAKLFSNTILFALPILRGEVNPVDLMLVEAIRVFFPSLYECIRNQKEVFSGTFSIDARKSSSHESQEIRVLIEKALEKEQLESDEGIKRVLRYLFPKLDYVYSNTYYDQQWIQSWSEAQRICSPFYFSRYFSYAVPHDDIPDKFINELIGEAINFQADPSISISFLDGVLKPENAEVLVIKLRQKADALSPEASFALAKLIALKSNLFPNPQGLFSIFNPFSRAALLVNELIQKINPIEERAKSIAEAMQLSPSLEFKLELFRWLRKKKGDNQHKDYFVDSQIVEIGTALKEQFLSVTEVFDLKCMIPTYLSSFIYVLNKFGDREFLVQKITEIFKSDSASVIYFLKAFSNGSDFRREHYESLSSMFDVSIVVDALVSGYPDIIPIPSEYPYKDDVDTDSNKLMALQFLWINEFVKAEAEAKAEASIDEPETKN